MAELDPPMPPIASGVPLPAPPVTAEETREASASTADPDKTVGVILDLTPSALVSVPTPEQLAAFAPPPPIVVPPSAPAPVFPQSPDPYVGRPQLMMVDTGVNKGNAEGSLEVRTGASEFARIGAPAGHLAPPSSVVDDPIPVPAVPKKFSELTEKTRFEIKAGFENAHPGVKFNPDKWEHIEPGPTNPRTLSEQMPHEKPIVKGEPEVDMSKISEKTRAEMRAGAASIAAKQEAYKLVVDREKERAAAALEEGKPPTPDAMSYTESH